MPRKNGELVKPDWQSRLWVSVLVFGLLLVPVTAAAQDPLPDGLSTGEWQKIRHQIEGDTGSIVGGATTQEAYLRAANAGTHDFFGYDVALDGDTLVVGASGEASSATGINGDSSDDSAELAGAAYVFVRNSGVWTQQAYIKASNTGLSDRFGVSVDIDGNTLVVGANGEDSSATGVGGNQSNNSAEDAGAAYVFVRSGSTWTQQAYLKASNTEAGDAFGTDVAIENDLIVVGAPAENGNSIVGAAYVFTRSGIVWSAPTYLKPAVALSVARFGQSLALDAGTLVVGAPGEQNTGAAYVFVRSGSTFTQQGFLKAPSPGAFDNFGFSVDVYSNTVVVGAPDEDSSTTGVGGPVNESSMDSGAAYVFRRFSGVWSFQAFIKSSNTGAGDAFGTSVSVYGDKLSVGAYLEDGGGNGVGANPADNGAPDAGAAYLFQRLGLSWSQLDYIKASTSESGDQFAFSLTLDSTSLVIGAQWQDGPPGFGGPTNQAGAAYVFEVPAALLSLAVPSDNSAAVNGLFYVPVSLTTSGLPIAGVSFSIEYDDACVDPDTNNDNIPDNLVWTSLPGFILSATLGGPSRLDFSIADVTPPISILPEGVLVQIGSLATCQPLPPAIFTDTPFGFSASIPPTFGDDFGQDVEGSSSSGTVRIWGGLSGDCNGSLSVGVGDLTSVGLEIFDGDGDFWLDTPNPTFIGNPVGCDANRNTQVNAADITCTNRRIFNLACAPALTELNAGSLRAGMTQPRLEVRSRFEGGIAWASAELSRHGNPVGSLALVLLVDGDFYDLSAIDQNQDGRPDQVVFPQGAISLELIGYESAGPGSGRLEILLADLTQQPLPEGTLFEIGLPALSPPPLGSLRFAASPRPSFGSTVGLDILGTFAIEGENIFSDGFESGNLFAWQGTP